MKKFLCSILNKMLEYFDNMFYREYVFRNEKFCAENHCRFYQAFKRQKYGDVVWTRCKCFTQYKDTIRDYEFQHIEMPYDLRQAPRKCPYYDVMLLQTANMNPFKKWLWKQRVKFFYRKKYYYYEGAIRDIEIQICCNERIR